MKTIKILMMLLLTSAFLVSCGGPESDAKKSAEIACEMAEAYKEGKADEADKILKDNKDWADKMDEKYGDDGSASDDDKKAYQDALAEAMKDCE
tara:strand:+ start:1115 stop:1396 length:282 start_codon:yes stop_codon:yes gene_type:complete